jgi:hypothetical protein
MVRNKYRNNEEFARYFQFILCQVPDDTLTQAENQKNRPSENLDPHDDLSVQQLATWNKQIKEMVRELARNEQNL